MAKHKITKEDITRINNYNRATYRRFNTFMKPDLAIEMMEQAKKEGISNNAYITLAVSERLERREKDVSKKV